jgi:glycopeptide antibiotics resistance protein
MEQTLRKLRRQLRLPRAPWLWWSIAALTALWLYWMTLRPQTTVSADLTPVTTSAASYGLSTQFVIGILGNIVVFVPWGAAVALAFNRRPRWINVGGAIVAGALLSASIELLQRAVPSRVSAWDDWALNTLGTALGAIAAHCISVWLGGEKSTSPPASSPKFGEEAN